MAKSDIFKAFKPPLLAICDKEGLVLDMEKELSDLAEDVTLVANLADEALTWKLLDEFQYADNDFKKKQSNYLGAQFSAKIPEEIKKKETGRSRFEEMFRDYLFNQIKSWDSRLNSVNGTSTVYSSQGYKRTMSGNRPESLAPKMALSSANSQYSSMEIDNDTIILKLVIKGEWRYLVFPFDVKRFHGAKKIAKPDITLDEYGYPIFHFSAVYDYYYTEFSNDYVLAVDVGLTNYATVSVVRTSDLSIVESSTTTLSADVHSLWNKVCNANKQIATLQERGDKREAVYHRSANTRRKREVAILAGREIAAISAQWNNAVVVFEDLTWITNTMNNGRWNRGELVKWTKHFVHLNGGRIVKVNSAYTSQKCHSCDSWVGINNHHDVYCSDCDEWLDRDYNATGNIGKRFIEDGTHKKYLATRKLALKFTKEQVQRVTITNNKKHKVISARSKLGPTIHRTKKLKKIVNKKGLEVKAKKLGSSKTPGVEGAIKKKVDNMTVTSNPNKSSIKKSLYDLYNLYNS